MLRLEGSRTKNTYNSVWLDGRLVASIWGKITAVAVEKSLYHTPETLFVCINVTDVFLHEISEVSFSEMGTPGIEFVLTPLCRDQAAAKRTRWL